jgi:hypothetical protein
VLSDASGVRTILKRYSQLHELNEQLKKAFPKAALPKFPGKKLFGNTKAGMENKLFYNLHGAVILEFVEKRKQKINQYLQGLTELQDVVEFPLFKDFCNSSL